MSKTRPFFGLRRLSLGIVRCACALVLILLAFAQPQFLGAARAAEPIVIDAALLRLTQQIDVPARAQGQLASMRVAEGDAVKQGASLRADQ